PLTHPRVFAGAARPEIVFGEGEAVVAGSQLVEATASAESGTVADEECVAPLLSPTDSPAQLMELCQAEEVGRFDDHDRGRGDVDSYFDHRGGDQDRDLSRCEGAHHLCLFGVAHAPVDQADAV